MTELQREVHQLDYNSAPTIVHRDPESNDIHNDEAQDLGHVDEVSAYEMHSHTPIGHIKTLDETERETIMEALYRNNGRRKKTAEELQISERTLYRKIKQYGLERR